MLEFTKCMHSHSLALATNSALVFESLSTNRQQLTVTKPMKKMMIYYAAGSLGALVSSLALWQCGQQGVSAALGVQMAPYLSWQSLGWLYPRIVIGGLWGLLFLLPLQNSRLLLKGLLLSLVVSAVQLFIIYPMLTNKGFAGLGLGTLTPLLVLIINAIWGVAAGLSIKLSR